MAGHHIKLWHGKAFNGKKTIMNIHNRYGFIKDAQRVTYRWLYTITKSFVDFNGVIPEKFDVVGMTHKVDVEYGNVGVDFKMVVREGFGWMNASYQVLLDSLYLIQDWSRKSYCPNEKSSWCIDSCR